MSCSDCQRLARQNRELAEELAEWRRQAALGADATLAERCHLWLRPPGQARVLAALLARPGRTLSALDLTAVASPDFERVNDPTRDAYTQICNLRRQLAARGFAGAIRTVWGQGYRIEAEAGAAILAAMGAAP